MIYSRTVFLIKINFFYLNLIYNPVNFHPPSLKYLALTLAGNNCLQSTDLLCAKLGSCEKKADLDVHTMVEEVKEEDVDGAENFNMKCITCKSIVRTIERHIHGERTEVGFGLD